MTEEQENDIYKKFIKVYGDVDDPTTKMVWYGIWYIAWQMAIGCKGVDEEGLPLRVEKTFLRIRLDKALRLLHNCTLDPGVNETFWREVNQYLEAGLAELHEDTPHPDKKTPPD